MSLTLFLYLYQLTSTLKGEVDVRTDILLAEHLVETGLMEHSLNGGVDTREDDLDARRGEYLFSHQPRP